MRIVENVKMQLQQVLIMGIVLCAIQSCHIYSFTGAAIEGKTINVHYIDNTARNTVASYSTTFTEKLRNKIQTQTSLSQINNDNTDYDIQGTITAYDVSVAAVQGQETVSKNRLTITVEIRFINRKNEKQNFTQNFTRFADFNATQSLQQVADKLNEDITQQLVDDIFNKCFVNW